jgi:transglutaminase-like putative cysteine protease
MRRTIFAIMLTALLLFTNVCTFAASCFDLSDISNGVVHVTYRSTSGKPLKLMIQNDSQRYFYDISGEDPCESFPLQMGPGKYIIAVFENTEDNRYRCVAKKYFYIEQLEEKTVFLNSIQNINWNEDMDAVKFAADITKDKTATIEKVRAIYMYMIENIRYDVDKRQDLGAGYIPDAQDTFDTNTGICYDYSSLFAAMLRSQGIPAKLVTGYSAYVSGYHAWNEVYIEETNEWISIDTTVDAYYRRSGETQMIKEMGNSTVIYSY